METAFKKESTLVDWDVLSLAFDITITAMRLFILLAIPFWIVALSILSQLADARL